MYRDKVLPTSKYTALFMLFLKIKYFNWPYIFAQIIRDVGPYILRRPWFHLPLN